MDKQQKTILIIFGAILLVALIVMLVVIFGREREIHIIEFIAPEFDTSAIAGLPENIDETLGYGEVDVNGNYKFSMYGMPVIENGELVLYFTSSPENEVLLLAKIYNVRGDEIGKSGLIRPGEYVETIKLTDPTFSDDEVKLKILSYEPDTYYSRGVASSRLIITKD